MNKNPDYVKKMGYIMQLSNLLMSFVEFAMAVLFICIGYKIYYKKKYYLINGYDSNKHSEKYPKDIGKIELRAGFIWLLSSFFTFFVQNFAFQMVIFFVPIVYLIIALITTEKKHQL